MVADFDAASASTLKESSYRLKALQQPSLIFDTYSYLHLLADPDARVNGGNFGQGLGSDFEFAIDTATADSIKLTGRFNETKLILIKATKQEADAFANKQLANSLLFENFNQILTYFKRITIGTRQYDIYLNSANRQITFTWIAGNGSVQTFTTGYYYTLQGLVFTRPFSDGTQTVTGFTNIKWDANALVLSFNANSASASITGIVRPLVLDSNAPRRWWQHSVDQDDFWASRTGFTVNGVIDAYNVTSIQGYNFLLFWANFNVSGGINYDLLGFVLNSSISYGPAFSPPVFTTNGRIIFPILGVLGTIPPAEAGIVANTRIQMSEPTGYYFVQTGPSSYDMVSAKDGLAWITWER